MKKTKIVLFVIITAVFIGGCNRSGNPTVDGDDVPPASENPRTPDITEPDKPQVTTTPTKQEHPNVIPSASLAQEDDITVSPDVENQIVMTAQSLLGIDFEDGGSAPSEGFDNSGFIYYVLRQNGYVNCPRGIHEQASMGNRIDSISELKPGDLVFFSDSGERAQYGGIYTGGGIMISCRMPGEEVREFNITAEYYKDSFFTGVRVL